MADNVSTQTSTLATVPDATSIATRLVSHSGDSSNVQVIVPVAITGSEGSWTLREYLKQDDAAFTPGTDAVVMMGGEFDDTSPDSVDEGDAGAFRMSGNRNLYVQLRDAAGNERGLNIDGSGNITVNVTGTVTVGSHAVTNAGTFAVQVDGAALTALQLIDNLVLAEDVAHQTGDPGVQMLAIRDDTLNIRSGAENDYEPLHTDANGALWVRHTTDTIAVTQSGTWDEVGINDSGNSITVDWAGTAPPIGAGVEATALRVTVATDSTGVLSVDDNGGALTVDNGGTFAVQVDGAALTALQLIDDTIFADDAAFTLTSSKVSMAGAIRDDALGALAAAETDAVPLRVDANGALWVIPSGTVTVTASNLDVQSGGADLATTTQAGAIQTAVEIMDDWDESDRAKVNIIVGQAGVAAGNGASGATVPRVTLANDSTGIIASIGTSVTPGTSAAHLGKAEDAGHSSGDTGVMVLGVRIDTPNAARADTDLDYIPLATYRTGAVRTAIPEEDFAALGSNHVKKYYSNSGATTDGIVWSPAAGKRWYVTDLIFTTSAAATVTFEDDLAAGDSTVLAGDFAANSGMQYHFGTPLFSGEDAADLLVTTTAGNIKVTVVGYEI